MGKGELHSGVHTHDACALPPARQPTNKNKATAAKHAHHPPTCLWPCPPPVGAKQYLQHVGGPIDGRERVCVHARAHMRVCARAHACLEQAGPGRREKAPPPDIIASLPALHQQVGGCRRGDVHAGCHALCWSRHTPGTPEPLLPHTRLPCMRQQPTPPHPLVR